MGMLLTKYRFFLVLACVTASYLALVFLIMPQGAFFSSDEGLKFIQLQNVIRKGWGVFTIDYPGRELDPALSYVPINNPPPLIRDGKMFAVYPVFFPLLAAPLYQLFSYTGLYLIPLLSGLLILAISGYIARLNSQNGVSPILLLGFCTPLLFYSLLFWDHTLGALLFTLALLLVMRNFEQPRQLLMLLAGIVMGLAIWLRSELYVMGLVMPATYFFFGGRRLRHVVSLCLGTLIALAPLWLFQFLVYGDFIGPHVGHFAWLGEELPVTTNRLAIIYYTLLEGSPNPVLSFLFIMAFVASILTVRSPKLRTNSVLVIIIFATLVLASIPNIVQAVGGRPMGGLISTTPFLAFSFVGLSGPSLRQKGKSLLALSLAYITLVCLITPVDPGLQWGPRFLLPILPPLTILALDNFHTLPRAQHSLSPRGLLRVCFLSIVAVSLALQLSSLRTMYILKTRDLELIEDTAQIDSPYVVSDEYGYAQYVAPLFYERQFFYVRDQEAYRRLTETFLRNSIHVFAVVTYPIPHRNVVDPLIASEGHTVKRVSDQLFEIQELDLTR
jgi:hypothetical protein